MSPEEVISDTMKILADSDTELRQFFVAVIAAANHFDLGCFEGPGRKGVNESVDTSSP